MPNFAVPGPLNVAAILLLAIYLYNVQGTFTASILKRDYSESFYRASIFGFVAWAALGRWVIQSYGLWELPQNKWVVEFLTSNELAIGLLFAVPISWIVFKFSRQSEGRDTHTVNLPGSTGIDNEVTSSLNPELLRLCRITFGAFYIRIVILRIMTFLLGGFMSLPKDNEVYNFLASDVVFLFCSLIMSGSLITFLAYNHIVAAGRKVSKIEQ